MVHLAPYQPSTDMHCSTPCRNMIPSRRTSSYFETYAHVFLAAHTPNPLSKLDSPEKSPCKTDRIIRVQYFLVSICQAFVRVLELFSLTNLTLPCMLPSTYTATRPCCWPCCTTRVHVMPAHQLITTRVSMDPLAHLHAATRRNRSRRDRLRCCCCRTYVLGFCRCFIN